YGRTGMKGFIAKTLSGLCLSGGLLTAAGCFPYYHNVVDPCWPERYNGMARVEANQGFITQIQNGHVLDQTLWNGQFERGTSRLTEGAREHLVYLVRRRPVPDTVVYVQSAQDLAYDAAAQDKFIRDREDLNRDRIAAVQKFLNAETAGTGLTYTVLVH